VKNALSIAARLICGVAASAVFCAHAQDRSDPRYQAGARELGPSEETETLRKEGVDALGRAKKLGKITGCADPYNYPYSTSSGEPAGFDIDIFRALAKRANIRSEVYWADTGTRGGLGRALRSSIDRGRCDFFMGLAVGPDDDDLKEHKLVLTGPYMGFGYVLVVQGKAADVKTLPEIKDKKIKIGVNMSTPMDDWLFSNGYDRELFFQSRRLMEGMAQNKVDAAMVFSTALGEAKKDFPTSQYKVAQGYVPEPKLRWNAAWAVPVKEKALKEFLEESFKALLESGEIKKIVEGYGIPFYPPFVN
jgi:polar amino acid transport system substrate-binding protein